MILFKCTVVCFFILFSKSLFAIDDKQLSHEYNMTDIATSRCDTELVKGKHYKVDVLASGNLEVSFLGKKGANLNGKFIYTKGEWEERQRVLKKHQLSENSNRRVCIKEELNLLRLRYEAPKERQSTSKFKIQDLKCWDSWELVGVASKKITLSEKIYISPIHDYLLKDFFIEYGVDPTCNNLTMSRLAGETLKAINKFKFKNRTKVIIAMPYFSGDGKKPIHYYKVLDRYIVEDLLGL